MILYFHCTTAPIWCYYKQLFGWDLHNQLALTSQKLHLSFSVLSSQNESTPAWYFQRQLPQLVKSRKKEQSEQSSSIGFSLFQYGHICMQYGKGSWNANLSFWILSMRSAWWVTAPKNCLEDVLCISQISSVVILRSLLQSSLLNWLINQAGKRCGPIYLRTRSLRQQQAVTSQVIPCRWGVAQIREMEPAGLCAQPDTAQLSATDTWAIAAKKTMAQVEETYKLSVQGEHFSKGLSSE